MQYTRVLGSSTCQRLCGAGRASIGLVLPVLAAMALRGVTGPAPVWGYGSGMEVGQKIDVVADIISASDELVLATLFPGSQVVNVRFPGGQRAKFIGQLTIPEGCCSLGVFDAVLVEKSPILCFLVKRSDDVLYHSRVCRKDFNNMTELCCGMGIDIVWVRHVWLSHGVRCGLE